MAGSKRFRALAPRAAFGLLGTVLALAAAVALGIAAVRWAPHVALFGVVSLIVVVVLAALGLLAVRLASPRVGRRTILELDLDSPVPEAVPEGPLGKRDDGALSLRDILTTLERAARDDRVSALIARVGRSGTGLARVQELRDAVVAFRSSGKRAIAFSETFGESAPGIGSYYLATAFDEIVLQPSGELNVSGLLASATFVKGTLDKLGIVPRFGHRREYKTAMNRLTETALTEAHRESVTRLSESQFGQIAKGVAETRGLTDAEARRLLESGPYAASEALERRLVDRVAYRDEAVAELKESVGEGARLLYLARYRARTKREREKGTPVALITGIGNVRRGRSTGGSFDERFRSMGSDTVAAAFRAAVADKKVKAIIFRVDSPGGSYVASDTIWRETVKAREGGKPVIVTMGNVAGSGGYFVAMAADKIVAQPGTITGSIGVVAGKMVTAGLRAKVGLSTDAVHTSPTATMWSSTFDYSTEEWEKLEGFLDRVYEDFTSKVVAGRRLSAEVVEEIARGRVWSGEDAKERGLIDELGGYPAALLLAREALQVSPDAPLRVVPFPRPVSPLARLRGRGPQSSEDVGATTGSLVPSLEDAVGAVIGIGGEPLDYGGVLSMPVVDVSV